MGVVQIVVRILVAEDNPFNQAVLLAALRKDAHLITVASDGEEALDAYRREPFDLVVLDLQMPRLTGLEVTAAIRQRERGGTGRTPIIALTAADGPDQARVCQAGGMDGYVAKPVRAARLREEIARVLGAGAVSRREVLAEAGGDEALVRRLLEIFREQSAELLDRAAQAVAEADAGSIEQASHALRSVCGHWSRGAAFSLAGKLEALGQGGELIGARPLFDDLAIAVARLSDEVGAAFPPERKQGP
jgi:CheY-like chemotaxis protein